MYKMASIPLTSQSPAAGPKGLAPGMVKGRKRRVMTDASGPPVGAMVHLAEIQDRDAPGW